MSMTLALQLFVGFAGALALLVGVALILAPGGSAWFGLHDPFNRLMHWFDQRRFIERYVYRHHRWFGAAITLGALLVSYRLLHRAAPGTLPQQLPELILLGAVRFLWIANTLLIIVGLVMIIRPSLLKGLEQWSNRWVAVGSPGRLDTLLHAAPRTAGMILAIAGGYLLGLMLIG